MTKHIVWDWNGTLFHDVDAAVAATNAAFQRCGLTLEEISKERWRALYCRPVHVFYERLLGRALQDGEWERLDEAFHAEYRRHMLACGLTEGAAELLARWRDQGRTQSLLSMWRHTELVPFVDQLGLSGYFLRIDGLRGPAGGPKAEHLERHLAALDPDPADVALIGDSIDDARAAEHVGASCVLYSGGFHDPAVLAEAGVPVAHTLAEAVKLLHL